MWFKRSTLSEEKAVQESADAFTELLDATERNIVGMANLSNSGCEVDAEQSKRVAILAAMMMGFANSLNR